MGGHAIGLVARSHLAAGIAAPAAEQEALERFLLAADAGGVRGVAHERASGEQRDEGGAGRTTRLSRRRL